MNNKNLETKDEILKYLVNNIDGKFDEIRNNISNIYINLGELVSNIDTVNYLKYMKQNIEK